MGKERNLILEAIATTHVNSLSEIEYLYKLIKSYDRLISWIEWCTSKGIGANDYLMHLVRTLEVNGHDGLKSIIDNITGNNKHNINIMSYPELTKYFMELKAEIYKVDAKIKEIDSSIPMITDPQIGNYHNRNYND